MEDGPQILPPPSIDPISRPSSTSTSASANLTQLPGISSLAASNSNGNGASTNSPQLRATNAPSAPTYTGASPAATSGGAGNNLPTCQNCQTSTTPLWRRDEFGAVLCNACGLFLKLHGRPRPISLKTDVIKSRNRVKTMRPDLAPKKKQQQQAAQNFGVATDPNSADHNVAVAAAAAAARRTSQKSMNGNHDGMESPISRTGTPSMYNQSLPSFIVDDPYQTGFGTTDGRAASPINGDRNIDAPQTHEQLIAHNSTLKTRVNELELINELIRGRLGQLEQQEASRGPEANGIEHAQLKSQVEMLQEREAHLSAQLDDSHRRENSLKRRLDELELELKESEAARDAALRELGGYREGAEMPDVVDLKEPKETEVAEHVDESGEAEKVAKVEELAPIAEPEEPVMGDMEAIQPDLPTEEEATDLEPPAKRPRLEQEEAAAVEEPSEAAPAVEVS